LGLDNGIASEVNSLFLFYDSSGILGSVYSVTSIQWLFMASNHGIYKYVDKQLSLLPDTQGKPGILVK
jgi:hypothetical protein